MAAQELRCDWKMDEVSIKPPLELLVQYDLAARFRQDVEAIPDCRVRKVIELITCKLLLYWIDCPDDKIELITDMAFMTFITNPEFQKYYN